MLTTYAAQIVAAIRVAFVDRANPTWPIGALEQRFLQGASRKKRVKSTAPDRKSRVVETNRIFP
jgi:hypothetical protein